MLRRLLVLVILLTALAVPTGADQSFKGISFGVITLNHPLMMYRQYLPFTDFLSERMDIPVELVLAGDYSIIIDDLVSGRIDVALLGGFSYVEAREASAAITPLCAILSADRTPTSRTIIFTSANRIDITSLHDLAGKTFAFASTHSTSGYLYPLCYLGGHGIMQKDFAGTKNLRTHEAVIFSVARGIYDAGAVSESIFERFKDFDLKPIARTDPYPGFVLVARKDNIPELERMRELLLKTDFSSPTLAARAMRWTPLLRNGFAPVSDQDYTSIRMLRHGVKNYGYGN